MSTFQGTSLAMQWLRLRASNAGGVGLIPGWGTKVPHAARLGQKKKKKKRNEYISVRIPATRKILEYNIWGAKEWFQILISTEFSNLGGTFQWKLSGELILSLFKKKARTIRMAPLWCSGHHSEEKLNSKNSVEGQFTWASAFPEQLSPSLGRKVDTVLIKFKQLPVNLCNQSLKFIPSLFLISQPRIQEPFTCKLSIMNTTCNYWVCLCPAPNHNNGLGVPRSSLSC